MSDTTPQTADGKVLFHFAMSLDGFVAGPNHEMDWMTGISVRPGLHDEYVTTTGAILGGRHGWDQAIDGSRPYGEGIRLYDNPGGAPIRLRAGDGDDRSALNVRYRPVT
jgi:hypothetical protein